MASAAPRKAPAVASLVALLVLAACRFDEAGEPMATEQPQATATATKWPTPATVTPPRPTPTPTQKAIATPIPTQEADTPVYEAYTTGLLVEEGGCQWLIGNPKGVRRVIIWPHGYTADTEDGATVIRNARGEIVGRVGERIWMGGGNEGINKFDAPCESDAYWIAAGPIHALPSDSLTPTAS